MVCSYPSVVRLSQIGDECKTHLCFEFISNYILKILYPYSFKTQKFSLNLVLQDLLWKASDLVRKDAKCFQKES